MDKHSDTPRTEAARIAFAGWKCGAIPSEPMQPDGWQFARTLERDLNAAQARIKELEGALSELHRFAFEQHGLSSAWVAPLNAACAALEKS